jgi:peptidoglycan L-alanyl-D-glutamate endopeptidase CwlK
MAQNREDTLIAMLYPPFGKLVALFLQEARKKAFPIGIFEGLRSFETQKEYYSRGRNEAGDIISPAKVITWAKPGKSYHQYGLAVDIVFDQNGQNPGFQWTWDEKKDWLGLGAIGKLCGLEAGVFWNKKDPPHFEKSYGFTPANLLVIYQKDKLQGVFKALDDAKKPS